MEVEVPDNMEVASGSETLASVLLGSLREAGIQEPHQFVVEQTTRYEEFR